MYGRQEKTIIIKEGGREDSGILRIFLIGMDQRKEALITFFWLFCCYVVLNYLWNIFKTWKN